MPCGRIENADHCVSLRTLNLLLKGTLLLPPVDKPLEIVAVKIPSKLTAYLSHYLNITASLLKINLPR